MLSKAIILVFAASVFAQDVEKFCQDRPIGLYCNPDNTFQKIECPSGNITTCPKSPDEMCQERGVLRQFGFKGGIARCVPRLNPDAVASFCESKDKGVYCWGDPEGNIRVQCPLGLVYKCKIDATDENKSCVQKTEKYAVCEEGGGGGVGSKTCEPISITVVSTSTKTEVSTVSLTDTVTKTETETSTETVTKTLSPDLIISTSTSTSKTTVVDRKTRTVVVVDDITSVFTSTTPVVKTITPTVITDCPAETNVTAVTSPTVTATSTSTSEEGGSGVGSTVDPPVFPPATETSATLTSISESSSAAPVPTQACPTDGSIQGPFPGPPGSKYTYQLTPERMVEGDISRKCRQMGGRMAYLSSTIEHWYLGSQICEPVWYKRWQGNDYNDFGDSATTTITGPQEVGCIALYPGGATSSPVNQCQEKLPGLCKFDN